MREKASVAIAEIHTILVTGGAGYIGAVLVPALLREGYRVRVLDLYIYGDHVLDAVKDHPNLEQIKDLGVQDVCFAKKRGLKVLDMVKSSWVYRQLRNFRAGIEGNISFLKRVCGLDRCTWRGRESFEAYVWSGIVAANLLVMARHVLS